MIIQEVPIKDLKAFDLNIKVDLDKNDEDYQYIKSSILKFNFVSPLVISKDLFVIDGVTRLKILKELMYEKVNCIILDIIENEAKLLRLSLNKARGDWKILALKEFFKMYEQEIRKYGSNLLGFSQDEIDLILVIDKFEDLEVLVNGRNKQLNLGFDESKKI